MSFVRQTEKILYQPDVLLKNKAARRRLPVSIGFDESPTGYSSLGLVTTRARLRFTGLSDSKAWQDASEEKMI